MAKVLASKVPASIAEITTEWVKEVLCKPGLIDSSLVDIQLEEIGAGVGLMAEMARIRLRYAGERTDSSNKFPHSLVVKCAAQNENREVAKILDFYQRESDFYNNLSNKCPIATPLSYFSAVNRETYDCVFIMEDLGEITISDQVAGASKEQAYHSIEVLADMHGKWWNVDDDYPWAYDFHCDEELVKLRDMIYLPALEPAIEKFSEHISDPMKEVMRRVGNNYDKMFVPVRSNCTFLHGDYRLDNIAYKEKDGVMASTVLDWQICGKGVAVFDVAYFLCQSLSPDLCEQLEEDLVRTYHQRLTRNVAVDYSFDQCWNDYKIWVLFCLIYPVSVCGSLDLANERGKQLATVMLERNLAAVERLGSKQFLQEYL